MKKIIVKITVVFVVMLKVETIIKKHLFYFRRFKKFVKKKDMHWRMKGVGSFLKVAGQFY